MKHIVTVTGDMNDADECSVSYPVELDVNMFEGWIEPFNQYNVTYRALFTALGEALREFSLANPNDSNWAEELRWNREEFNPRLDVLTLTCKKLNLGDDFSPYDLMETLYDFLPGTCDYPVHTLYSITAVPDQGQIEFY